MKYNYISIEGNIVGTNYSSGCMGANLNKEEFTELHEEMWELMEEFNIHG